MQKQEVPKTSFGDLIIIIRRNGAKTISLPTSFGDLIIIRNGAKTRSPENFVWGLNKKRCKNKKSPKTSLGDLIIRNGAKTISFQASFVDLIIRNGAKTISHQTSFGDLIIIRIITRITIAKLWQTSPHPIILVPRFQW